MGVAKFALFYNRVVDLELSRSIKIRKRNYKCVS